MLLSAQSSKYQHLHSQIVSRPAELMAKHFSKGLSSEAELLWELPKVIPKSSFFQKFLKVAEVTVLSFSWWGINEVSPLYLIT